MNTITFTKVQTQDRTINQLQANADATFQQLGNDINQVTVIGEIKLANLTEDQFQQQAGPGWILCDGRSIIKTSLNKLTGQLVAPSLTIVGAQYFVRIN